jgi:pyridoxine 5-phosphate synthase
MPDLIVNVDHIATIRQARLAHEPDPVHAAHLAELGGAHGIIVHLREDRRHIQDRDVDLLNQTLGTKLHLEMAATEEMQGIALKTKPFIVCLVPEKREELTTEGGLNLIGREDELQKYLDPIHAADITSSLFIDPEIDQIQAATQIGAEYIELHTGHFAEADSRTRRNQELDRIKEGIAQAHNLGLKVNLGHGLTYANIHAFAHIPGISEFSIGHSVVARASLIGMKRAVSDMLDIIHRFC